MAINFSPIYQLSTLTDDIRTIKVKDLINMEEGYWKSDVIFELLDEEVVKVVLLEDIKSEVLTT